MDDPSIHLALGGWPSAVGQNRAGRARTELALGLASVDLIAAHHSGRGWSPEREDWEGPLGRAQKECALQLGGSVLFLPTQAAGRRSAGGGGGRFSPKSHRFDCHLGVYAYKLSQARCSFCMARYTASELGSSPLPCERAPDLWPIVHAWERKKTWNQMPSVMLAKLCDCGYMASALSFPRCICSMAMMCYIPYNSELPYNGIMYV